MQAERLKHEFVEFIPDELAETTLYISIPYATASHRCACGCGSRVVTPLTPTDWSLIFDGEAVSLTPSIGNWNFDCQSHYWVRSNRVIWSRRWSRARIDIGRARDQSAKERYFDGDGHRREKEAVEDHEGPAKKRGWILRQFARLGL